MMPKNWRAFRLLSWPGMSIRRWPGWWLTEEEVQDPWDFPTQSCAPAAGLEAIAHAVGIVEQNPLPTTEAAQAEEQSAPEKQGGGDNDSAGDNRPRPTDCWPYPVRAGECKAIETNEKPKGRSKAKAKAVA